MLILWPSKDACIIGIVRACTMAMAHTCTMAVIHACALAITHACTIAIVHISCSSGLMFCSLAGETRDLGDEVRQEAGRFAREQAPQPCNHDFKSKPTNKLLPARKDVNSAYRNLSGRLTVTWPGYYPLDRRVRSPTHPHQQRGAP